MIWRSFSKAFTMSDNELHTDISVNVITLLSALVALILLSRQLFGQNFAPAERFRRGQSSAMGPWAKRTRLQWRWSQFRFETLYTTPEIVLSCFCVDQRHQRVPQPPGNDIEWITGSLESQEKTLMVSPSVDIMTDETVSWLLLLRDLHRQEWELQRHGCYNGRQPGLRLAGSALRFRERSWDSVSPETVRPCAITSISDVAVLARRLGMTWTDFREIILVHKW